MRRASRKRSIGKAATSGRRAKVRHLALQPDALGVATRLAAARLREAGIVLKPLLRSAGLSASQITMKDLRVGVASQITFLELAAKVTSGWSSKRRRISAWIGKPFPGVTAWKAWDATLPV